MRWVKYVLICCFSVAIFAGGGACVVFMPELKTLLHTEKPRSTYTLELSATMQIPYERYTSTIYFELSKKPSTEPSSVESTLAPVLAKITERIAKEHGAQDSQSPLCQSQAIAPRNTIESSPAPESSPMITSSFACTISAQNLPAYKSMLKEIDYIALKSGQLRVKVSAPAPTITREQAKQAMSMLRGEILAEIDSSVAFYADKTQKSCHLTQSHESPQLPHTRHDTRHAQDDIQHEGSEGSTTPSATASTMPFTSLTTPESISLPLEQGEPMSLVARISIACE